MARDLEFFLKIIHDEDPEQAEGARDHVTAAMIADFVPVYWALDHWGKRDTLLHIIQDHMVPEARDLWLDYLRNAPDEELDHVQLTKAVALCHLRGDFGIFMDLYNDRALLMREVRSASDEAAW